MNKKQTYLIIFLLIAVVFAINILSFRNGHPWGDDFTAYIGQAKAIVNGNFDDLISIHKYRIENAPAGPQSTGPLLGQWGFPILLSPIYYAFGLDILPMKIYITLYFLASLIIVFLLFQDRLQKIENLLLVALIAFNPVFFKFKEVVHPDTPFLFFSLLSLFLIKQAVIVKRIWINKFFSYSFIGFIIFFSVEIRTIGFVLLPTLLFVQFIESNSSIKKMVQDRYNVLPYIVFLVFYVIQDRIFPSGSLSSYFMSGESLESLLHGVIDHIKYYTFLPARFFLIRLDLHDIFSHDTNLFSMFLYGMMMLLVLRGIIINLKKDYIFTVYGVLTLTILILYPGSSGFRYIIPVFPFFLYFLFAGLSTITLPFSITEKLKHVNINAVHLFGSVLLIIFLFHISNVTHQNIEFNKKKETSGPYSSDSTAMFDYIKENTDKDDVIIFAKTRAMALYGDRKSIHINTFDPILHSSADYFLYIKNIQWWYKFNYQDLKNNFKCIFENKTLLLCNLKERLADH